MGKLEPPSRPEPRRSDSVEIVEAILAAGRELVAQTPKKLNMRLVAERAGVGVASLYRYFPDQSALITEIFRRQHQRVLEDIVRVLQEDPPVEIGVRRSIDAFVGFDDTEAKLRRALNFEVPLRWTLDDLETVLAQTHEIMASWLTRLDLGLSKTEIDRRVYFGIAFTRGVVMLRLQQPKLAPPVEEIVHTVSAVVIDIVNGKPPPIELGAPT